MLRFITKSHLNHLDLNHTTPYRLLNVTLTSEITTHVCYLMNMAQDHTFSLSLFKTLSDGCNDNVFISPLSIHLAMSLVYMGSEGNTAKELSSALKLEGKPKEAISKEHKKLIDSLGSFSDVLSLANKIWIQEGMPVKESYLEIVKKCYDSDITFANFGSNPVAVKDEINGWVESKTNEKIKDLVKDGMITGLTRLFLVNAIYFKANWDDQFKVEHTHESEFEIGENKSVKVNMMFKNSKFATAFDKENKCIIVELPYVGLKHSMVLALPEKSMDIKEFEKNVTSEMFNKWNKNLKKGREIDLFLPKFKVTFEAQLIDTFGKLGVGDLFTSKADLTGITESEKILVSDIVHKAFVEVNEEGTEAAAATGIGIRAMCMPPQIMMNRPFLFFIKDTSTGAIVFMGRIVNPVE